MDAIKGSVDELFDRIKDGEPWLVDISMEDHFIIFNDVKMVCWCCGAIRSEHHFIISENKITYDHILGYCIEPYVGDVCRHAVVGSRLDAKCPFKDEPDAKCS